MIDPHIIFIALCLVFLTVGVMCAIWNRSAKKLKLLYDNIQKRILSLEDASKLNKISGKRTDDDRYEMEHGEYPVLSNDNGGLSERFNAVVRRSRNTMVGALCMAGTMGVCTALTWPDPLPAVDPQHQPLAVMEESGDRDVRVKEEVPPVTEEIAGKVETETDRHEETPDPPEPAVDLTGLRDVIVSYRDREIIRETSVPLEQSFLYLKGIKPCEEKALYCDRLIHADLTITIRHYEESIKSLFLMKYQRFEKGWGETLDRYFLEQFRDEVFFDSLCQSSPQCAAIGEHIVDKEIVGELRMMWYLRLFEQAFRAMHHDLQIEKDGTDTMILNWRDYIHQAGQYYPGSFTQFGIRDNGFEWDPRG